jgi:hypothetical protein
MKIGTKVRFAIYEDSPTLSGVVVRNGPDYTAVSEDESGMVFRLSNKQLSAGLFSTHE